MSSIEFNVTVEALWSRMERAVERVNERLRRTVAILEEAGVPYAVAGGHALAGLGRSDRRGGSEKHAQRRYFESAGETCRP